MRLPGSVARVVQKPAVVAGEVLLVAAIGLAGVSPPAMAEGGPSGSDEVGGLDRSDPAPDLDNRVGRVAPSERQLDRVEALGADVRWTRFGTPASLVPRGSAFTSSRAGGPVAVARGFLRDNRLLFRMSAGAVRRLELVRAGPLANLRSSPGVSVGTDPATDADTGAVTGAVAGAQSGVPASGPQVVLLRESFGALPAGAGGLIALGVVGRDITYVSSSAFGSAPPPVAASLTPTEAWLLAADALGRPVAANAVGPVAPADDHRDWTSFTVAGFTQVQQARLVAVGLPSQGVRPAYEVNVVDVQDGTALASTSFVDAVTGDLLLRHDRVSQALEGDDPRAPVTSAYGPDCQPGCGVRLARTPVNPVWEAILQPSMSGIMTVDDLGPATKGFTGGNAESNNALASPAWTSPLARRVPGRAADNPATMATRWTDAWRRSGCDISGLRPGGNDVGAAVANVFHLHNELHDWTYQLGFTEDVGNLQLDNKGRGGLGRDRQTGFIQAGALTGGYPTYLGRNDANQVTLQDGIPAITNLYLFQPVAARWYGPCVDGALDPTIVAHEYAHAVTNRMVGGPDAGLTTPEGRAIGEAWSDLLAAEYLWEYARTGPDGSSPTAIGAYVAGNRIRGVRDHRLGRSPLTYADTAGAGDPSGADPSGADPSGAELVRNRASVWAAVNWDIRSALIRKYADAATAEGANLGRHCADGAVPVTACPGNRRWVQLLFDSLPLLQSDASMLDARDALLAADRMRFDGANATELWRAFARRGLGAEAQPPSVGHAAVPDFTVPDSLSGGELRAATLVVGAFSHPYGTPVPVRVFVGQAVHQAVPAADSDPTTGLDREVRLVPGRYALTWSAPGFGMGRASVTVYPGRTRYLSLRLHPNLASARNGAEVTSTPADIGAESVIDEREGTAWTITSDDRIDRDFRSVRRLDGVGDDSAPAADGAEGGESEGDGSAGNESGDGRAAVAVDLAGRDPAWVRAVRVSAMTHDRFTALRSFAIEVCTQQLLAPCAVDQHDRWRRIYTSPDAAFPGTRPRPVTPDLTFRDFDVPDNQATHVRLVVLETQCTGNPEYHGEQESDLLSMSDCLTSSKAATTSVAELMVYGVDP
ncbi:M36 family metallopeptidase [Actinopolymorpha sp. B17G11]|uniref:M36 family metallopeptidase n=1 Tax=Actinopolymorpha sp. B17G11 TaxID=3160861 RepID=UPI0032E524E0